MSGAVYPLTPNQREAADPQRSVWLSASAGTGKTQVLSARVLRLLLQRDVNPGEILCLTFTKAGAAEMAVRINEVLARWVRLGDTLLFEELEKIGAPNDVATRARARTLFASVLDCPGGGLRIDTIHAFSQWLLANFPEEADIIPGARPMEDRERELLFRDVLGQMLAEAERSGDAAILDAVAEFTTRKDPAALQTWLMRCASSRSMWVGRGAWQSPMRARVLGVLGVPSDADEQWASEVLDPEIFPDAHLRQMLPVLGNWTVPTGVKSASFLERWLQLPLAERAGPVSEFYETLLTTKGQPRVMKKPSNAEPRFTEWQQAVAQSVDEYEKRRALLSLADFLASALELGRAFYLRWDAAKQREGLLDFDDLIQRAAELLQQSRMSDWIRYKLDRRFDHILVDEAQDTNAAQWTIIDALIDDFFSGEGASGDSLRTIFTVGDTKQAIFGFQGTSPENFKQARERVREAMSAAAQGAARSRRRSDHGELAQLDLDRSYRTAQPVLTFVDCAIAAIGSSAFGLEREPPPHEGADRAGLVTLWEPVRDRRNADDEEAAEGGAERGDDDAGGEENWLARHDRQLADNIAAQVKAWLSAEPFVLEKGGVRAAGPGDIMVLVRKRKELAQLIVARLHAYGVPVAGVDRLRLGAPLAVKDLMAALRFAAQPLDDLNLASLLASPLIGWSQDDLLAFVPRGERQRLWHHLGDHDAPAVVETVARLRDLLTLADFETPQALLHWLLLGPWKGRQRLVERLGREANDPIDELVNAAFAYEAGHVPSLAGFIQWFDAGEGELKRDPGEAPDLVRVMTVHGSKGLEAPIVILADATGRPGKPGDLSLEDAPVDEPAQREVPLPALRNEERRGPVETAHENAVREQMQEHWRLLYVAMTRAEEALFIGGSLGPREKEPHEDSWYARLAPLFGEAVSDPIWQGRRELGKPSDKALVSVDRDGGDSEGSIELPDWALRPIGAEPRPPRPLAPSAAGEERGADPPLLPAEAHEAARRGVLIHRLLERLPDIAPHERMAAADAWLEKQAGEFAAAKRDEMRDQALDVLASSAFADVFSPGALAEVPLAATVGGEVIAGTADRLLVEPDRVTVIDFKTSRRPPENESDIPAGAWRQMAAYVAALEVIYPGREVRAALLYTHTPRLFALDPQRLAALKADFTGPQESFSGAHVENARKGPR